MANKRNLKKLINYSSSELFAECVAVSLYSSSPAQEDLESLLSAIIAMRNEYVDRISHVEPGVKAKDYFDKLIQDFNQQVGEVLEQINSLN